MGLSVYQTTERISRAEFVAAARGGEKFTDDVLKADPVLAGGALDYVFHYSGRSDFMVSLQKQFAAGRALSIPQMRGALNVLLSEVNKICAASIQPIPEAVAPATDLPECLTYTIVFPSGEYRTLRIEDTENWDLMKGTGTLVAKFLSGPDNERSFTGFAFVKPDGQVQVWKRFKDGDSLAVEALKVLVANPSGRGEMTEAYAMKSGRCSKCGRPLTVPASLHRGMGPICAQGGED